MWIQQHVSVSSLTAVISNRLKRVEHGRNNSC
jgi:hypothetical protein